jgi:hypothetical protein
MQPLKLTTVTVHKVSYRDLERFIHEQYPLAKWYGFVPDQECGNDSDHAFTVSNGPLDEYEKERVGKVAAGEIETFVTGALLDDLCARGLIPAGDYLVSVCW